MRRRIVRNGKKHIKTDKIRENSTIIVKLPSEEIKKRVDKAREIQLNRFENSGIYANAKMNDVMLKKYCKISLLEFLSKD